MKDLNYNYLAQYSDHLQSEGRYTFTLEEAINHFEASENAIKKGLNRLVQKGHIHSIYRGFYIIIPPEYSAHGVLPSVFFIDDLMHFVNKPYYVGLLSAAALHGAAHQQPQEFYVITVKPAQRPLISAGLKINFMVKSRFPSEGLIQKKTAMGYVQVSSPELTAIDLLIYVNNIGGINRVATVLQELCEVIDPQQFHKIIDENTPISVLQRLGYLMEHVLDQQSLANGLYKTFKDRIGRYNLLDIAQKSNPSRVGNRWKINVNTKIDTDL